MSNAAVPAHSTTQFDPYSYGLGADCATLQANLVQFLREEIREEGRLDSTVFDYCYSLVGFTSQKLTDLNEVLGVAKDAATLIAAADFPPEKSPAIIELALYRIGLLEDRQKIPAEERKAQGLLLIGLLKEEDPRLVEVATQFIKEKKVSANSFALALGELVRDLAAAAFADSAHHKPVCYLPNLLEFLERKDPGSCSYIRNAVPKETVEKLRAFKGDSNPTYKLAVERLILFFDDPSKFALAANQSELEQLREKFSDLAASLDHESGVEGLARLAEGALREVTNCDFSCLKGISEPTASKILEPLFESFSKLTDAKPSSESYFAKTCLAFNLLGIIQDEIEGLGKRCAVDSPETFLAKTKLFAYMAACCLMTTHKFRKEAQKAFSKQMPFEDAKKNAASELWLDLVINKFDKFGVLAELVLQHHPDASEETQADCFAVCVEYCYGALVVHCNNPKAIIRDKAALRIINALGRTTVFEALYTEPSEEQNVGRVCLLIA